MPAQPTWHYHATLRCGHSKSFNLDTDVIPFFLNNGMRPVLEMHCNECEVAQFTKSITRMFYGTGRCNCNGN